MLPSPQASSSNNTSFNPKRTSNQECSEELEFDYIFNDHFTKETKDFTQDTIIIKQNKQNRKETLSSPEVSFNTTSSFDDYSSHPSYNYFVFSSKKQKPNLKHDQLHTQIQQIITQRKILGNKIKLKHFKILKNSFTINDFIQYIKSDDFNSLSERPKKLINLLIQEMSKLKSKEQKDQKKKYNINVSKIHNQFQNIIKKSFGQNILLEKEIKIITNSFIIDDIIQYTKTIKFNSLGKNHKEYLCHQINVKLVEEFQGQNISLSQNLDEYIKRDIIPSLPLGINSYAEYENCDLFDNLSDIQKSRVRKLILLEYRLNPQRIKITRKRLINVKRNGLVVICADDIIY
ncbi:hypothetical protein C1645_874883 [Glomus cerebriforme]|uniref:Uncharacterized protein n=1 Tax=Glomus cerebriforme TaxID=658196 RepID=A0A397T4R7_9GLOM|nr:hypothetical protein C1645_874883 [Glomus cerebriforme]